MPTLSEWLAGRTDDGVELPAERVAAYRRKVQAMGVDEAVDWSDCAHRGDVIKHRKADLCGRRGEMFPVYACAVHGECVLTRFCERQPEQTCYLCQDVQPRRRAVGDVAIVIPCHNYGRFLAQAIESALDQSIMPADVLVVDDASTDETAEVAARYAARGVRYVRAELRSVYRARGLGFSLTSSPYVVFLDADDWLGPTYLERGRAAFTDPAIGIAYTDLIEQPGGAVRHHAAINIEGQNYIHAGAMVRREAIDQAEGFGETRDVINTRADWFLWRRLLRAGWRAVRYEGEYFYRQHGDAVHLGDGSLTYYELASLGLETITIVFPLSGRKRFLPHLVEWVAKQAWPSIELLVVDSGDDPEFTTTVRAWLASLACPVSFVPMAGIRGLADANRRETEHFRAVQQIMPRIYRHLSRVQTEFALIVEEDVEPPLDAIPRLLRAMRPDVAAVSGVYRSRWTTENLLAWNASGEPFQKPREGVESIGGSGFGCLLYRRSAFREIVLHAGGSSGNYDPNAGNDLRSLGWSWLIDWDVRCVHDGIGV